jgi:hypothetical protein
MKTAAKKQSTKDGAHKKRQPVKGKPRLKKEPGKIITFYSFKGGTGRSMALANVAWVLASHGKQVLVVDWDFEAPGLHRYFRPFLPDKDLVSTPGLLDFFWEFQRAATTKALQGGELDSDWFHAYSNLLEYATGLDVAEGTFADGGGIDFIAAGRQFAGYGTLVTSFPWEDFYQYSGGGVLLEHVKVLLRQEYDYILIDSRTGLSDSSGICTVQMPDEVVMCFTYNRQSIMGVKHVGQSIMRQRRGPKGEPTVKLWPLACRVDLSEKDRLDAARNFARRELADHIWHIRRQEKNAYWSESEVLYFAFYAYEEILATVADRSGQGATLLSAMERVTAFVSDRKIKALKPTLETDRFALRAQFLDSPGDADLASPNGEFQVYVSYAHADVTDEVLDLWLSDIAQFAPYARVFYDRLLRPGAPVKDGLLKRLYESQVVVIFVGRQWRQSSFCQLEFQHALRRGKMIIPVFDLGINWEELPDEIRQIYGLRVDFSSPAPRTVRRLAQVLGEEIAKAGANQPQDEHEDDPQKGRWGGRSRIAGRTLSATVTAAGEGWFNVHLLVKGTASSPLRNDVTFHLHPTFSGPKTVTPTRNQAKLMLGAYGAFTVGVETDGGETRLELDLAKLRQAPKLFKER